MTGSLKVTAPSRKTKGERRKKEFAFPLFLSSPSLFIPIALFVGAFLVRLGYLLQIRSTLTFTHPLMDSLFYIKRAQEIAAGTFQPQQAFFMGPLYPYFLAGIIKLLGMGWMKIRLVQIVIGSLSVVLIYDIAVTTFHGRKIAVTAAVSGLFWGGLIYYDTNLLMAFLVVFLNLALLRSLIGLLKNSAPKNFFFSGVLLGVAALARGNILLFIPFCLFWFYRSFRSRLSPVVLGKRIAVFLLGTALLILPVTLRNYLVEEDLVLLTSNGGLNFYIGNNPDSQGIYIPLQALKLPYRSTPSGSGDRMDIQARDIAEKVMGRKMKSSETAYFWYYQAKKFFRRDPGAFIRNLATKIALCWNGKEIPQIENFYYFRKRFSILGVPLLNFGFIAPLALWGMVLGLASPEREIRLLIYYLIAMTLAISLFFVTSRYRIPMVPIVLILAVFGFVDIVNRLRERKWFNAGKGLLGVGVFAFLVNQPMVTGDFAADHYNRGYIYYRIGNREKALEEFSTCLSIRPGYTDAYRARGVIYRQMGKFPQALEEFKKALDLRSDYPSVKANIALVYLEQDRLEEAEKILLKAIKLSPEKSGTYDLLGRIYAGQSRFDLAAREFQKAVGKNPGKADASMYYNLGVSYHRIGQFELAKNALTQAMAKDPTLGIVHIAMGNLFFDLRRFEEAVKQFEIAQRQSPGVSNQYNLANAYAEAGREDKAIETYENLLLKHPRHKRALNNLGNAYSNRKQYDKAIACYEKVLRFDPQFAAALHNLGDIYKELKNIPRSLDYYKQSLLKEKEPSLRILLEEKIQILEK